MNDRNEHEADASAESANPLVLPASFLIALAAIMLLLQLASMPTQIMLILDALTPMVQIMQSSFLALWIATQLVVLFGAINMIRLKGYRLAMTAAIIAFLPLCSPLVIFGIPFGIWTALLLQKPAVKQRFA